MTVLQAGLQLPHDPASIFALVLTFVVAIGLYMASRPGKDPEHKESK